MGKTVTAELAYYSPGKTKNPHDVTRTPGGSSSGSAAAVACNMVPLAVGSQTNGSVIRPASFCGVVGYKPSKGYISRHLVLQVSRTLDQVGIFSNSIEDAALIGEQLFGHDKQDPDSSLNPRPKLLAVSRQKPPMEPLLAYIKLPFMDKLDEDVADGFSEIKDELKDLYVDYGYALNPLTDGKNVGPLKMINYKDMPDYGFPQVATCLDSKGNLYVYHESGFLDRSGSERYIAGNIIKSNGNNKSLFFIF